MARNRTPPTPPQELSDAQRIVIMHLIGGSTQRAAAAAAGVDESTVSRWANGDAAFIAELNIARYAVYHATVDALRALRLEAVSILAAALRGDDPDAAFKAALAIVRMNVPAPDGATVKGRIESDLRLANMW